MKRYPLYVIATLISGMAHAQYVALPQTMTPGLNQPGTTLPQVVSNLNASAFATDTGEGGYAECVSNFQKFWQAHAFMNDSTASDSTGSNMFSEYYSALSHSVAERELGGCGTSGYHGDWQLKGPDANPYYQAIGYVSAIWANPHSSTLLAATVGGLFKSTDGGSNWKCVTDNAPVVSGVTGIGSIAVNPLDTNTIFLGTTGYDYGAGILESFDGGNTWTQEFVYRGLGYLDSIESVQGVFFTPDGGRIYAFIGPAIYTRTNGIPMGSWVNITPATGVNPANSFTYLQFNPGDQENFFVSDMNTNAGVFEAFSAQPDPYDWLEISNTLPTIIVHDTSITYLPVFPYTADTTIVQDTITSDKYLRFSISALADTLYAAACTQSDHWTTLYKYDYYDLSPSWTRWCTNMPAGGYPSTIYGNPSWLKDELAVSAANPANIYYGGDIPSQSVDYGRTFYPIGDYDGPASHADIRGLCLRTATNTTNGINDVLYIANDGGVSCKPAGNDVITDSTSTLTDVSGKGLACGEFWGVATSEAGGLMAGGMQHDGLATFETDATPEWEPDPYGASDAATCVFDVYNRKEAYGLSNNYGRAYSYPFGGRTLGRWGTYVAPPEPNHPPQFIDNYNTQYEGGTYLWQKLNSESSFNVICPQLPATYGQMSAICIDPYQRTVGLIDTLPIGYVVFSGQPTTLYFRDPAITLADTFVAKSVPGGYPITGVAMNSDNPALVLISRGGADTDPSPSNRVDLSLDGGNHWMDISYGLPLRVPVTNIIYQEGTGGNVFFCATEVGIYRCDISGLNEFLPYGGIEWECFSNGAPGGPDFPNAFVTDLKINYCEGKLYAATYGRAIWGSDLYVPGTIVQATTTITGDTTWSGGNQYIEGSIDIQNGATLHITADSVHMPEGGVIAVEPGGELIVMSSLLTNDCSQCFWQGVESRGQVLEPQNPISNQGVVIIENGSTIQHAITGVRNSNAAVEWSENGGIIVANGSYFTDNETDVDFEGYDNYWGAGLHDNVSRFTNCTFLLDSSYKGNRTPGYPMHSMVSLHSVEGIPFIGCQLLNRDTFAAYRLVGEGIDAYNSGFKVKGNCVPGAICLTPTIPSRFCGFTNGVMIHNLLFTGVVPSIDDAVFDSVSVGVNNAAFNNLSVTRSTFTVGNGLSVGDVSSPVFTGCYQNIGILNQNATQFRIEENTFTGKPNHTHTDWYNFGVVVANSGGVTNTVYRNAFGDSLTEGVFAAGQNTNEVPFGAGLQILCNAFSANSNDIGVASDGGTWEQGIAYVQGVYTPGAPVIPGPTGNTFSHSTSNIANSVEPIQYYFDTANTATERPNVVSGLTYISYETAHKSCPSTIDGIGNGVIDPIGGTTALAMPILRQHKRAFDSSNIAYGDSLVRYNSAIDFGNTDSLVAVINRSKDTTALYTTLRDGAPYISATALNAVGSGAKLPYYSMMQVLQQNPDDLRDNNFITGMEADYSLSNSDVSMLESWSLSSTNRTLLEMAMGSSQTAMAEEGNIILMALESPIDTNMVLNADSTWSGICTDSMSIYYGTDSNAYYVGLDSVATWLQKIGGLWTNYALVGYYNFRGQTGTADDIFSNIGNLLPAGSQPDSATYDTCAKLWNVIKGAENAGRNIYSLDSEEIASLDIPATPVITYNTGTVMMAGLTSIVYVTSVPLNPCVSITTYVHRDGTNNTPPPITNVNSEGNNEFSAYPNPTSGVVTFAYDVPGAADVDIVITDIVGEKVQEIHTGNKTGKAYWNPRGMAAGVYIYEASADGKVVCKGKLVVING